MSMAYIRHTFGVPAKRGGRVQFSGNSGSEPLSGTIVGSSGARLHVVFDGEAIRRVLHPTWELVYLPAPTP